jgi:5-methylcytosine-specific restriction enzyme A
VKRTGGWARKSRLRAKAQLRSKTGLTSTGGLKRVEMAKSAPKPKPAPRDTGPSAAVRNTVKARAGMCCERCGVSVAAAWYEVHHRRPRQMGGDTRPETNLPSNLLLLCMPRCHSEVESSRQISYERGWLVHAEHDPAVKPVWLAGRGLVLLRPDGSVTPYNGKAAA